MLEYILFPIPFVFRYILFHLSCVVRVSFIYFNISTTLSALYLVQSLKHNPNGRFVVVCGDGEYIIYTALAWRNRSFGSALEFVWSADGEYAVRESTSKIKIFSKNFQVYVYSSYYTTFIFFALVAKEINVISFLDNQFPDLFCYKHA